MKLVMACGCFDLLHAGHIRHLRAARVLGDRLVVVLTPDRFVGKPGRPVLKEDERAVMLQELRCVDEVFLNPFPTAVQAILQFRPHVYVKGKEYEGQRMTAALQAEKDAVGEVWGRLVFVGDDLIHTSDLIAGHTSMEVLGCK